MSEALGAFLRARRASLGPADIGMPPGGRRKVAGLRREEVAVICGISVDYYTRIEQGRESHPSTQVLDALSRGLSMSGDERAHLFALADLAPPRQSPVTQRVDPDLLRLMDGWPDNPAVVTDDVMNVLARNRLGRVLYAGFEGETNLLRMTFVHPHGREFYVDWQRAAQASVANLRAAVGRDVRRPEIDALVDELTARSSVFRDLWERHDVRGKTHEPKEFRHPRAGSMTLTYHAFDVRSAPGQQLLVYAAEPGTDSAVALSLLKTLDDPAATPHASDSRT
jgi:transcriptional regulator with XRE-family HTH domain